MTDLVVLTEGGAEVGFGHLMRCISVKEAWVHGTAKVLAQMEGATSAPKGVEVINWLKKPSEIEGLVSDNAVLLVDSYRVDYDFFLYLKKLFPFIVVLDDYNRITYPVDLIICPATYGNQSDYSNQSGRVFGGPEYVILRPDIQNANQIHIQDNIENILVTFGGSQQDETLYQHVNNLLEGKGYKVHVITGNDSIAKELNSLSSIVYGRLNAKQMTEIMSSVDLAITASGQTLNELAWLGVPSVAIKTGEDQHGNWDYYARHRLVLGSVLPEEADMKATINSALHATWSQRMELSRKLRDLFHTVGANQVSNLIYTSWSSLDG